MRRIYPAIALICTTTAASFAEAPPPSPEGVRLVVLGIAQDGGVPQAGTVDEAGTVVAEREAR